jgi:hypothetical protein
MSKFLDVNYFVLQNNTKMEQGILGMGKGKFSVRTRLEVFDDDSKKYITDIDKNFADALILKATRGYSDKEIISLLNRFATEAAVDQETLQVISSSRTPVERTYRALLVDFIEGTLSNVEEDISKLTPWILEKNKDQSIISDLLGPSRDTLPVVVYAENKYIHECTEELVLGILVALNGSKPLMFLGDCVENLGVFDSLRLEDIAPNYLTHKEQQYSCITPSGYMYFNTVDFVQGIITGAMWINKDPHSIISNIMMGDQMMNF